NAIANSTSWFDATSVADAAFRIALSTRRDGLRCHLKATKTPSVSATVALNGRANSSTSARMISSVVA
ncbi:unnamed protein product, partial [Aphanomyces euteiches]